VTLVPRDLMKGAISKLLQTPFDDLPQSMQELYLTQADGILEALRSTGWAITSRETITQLASALATSTATVAQVEEQLLEAMGAVETLGRKAEEYEHVRRLLRDVLAYGASGEAIRPGGSLHILVSKALEDRAH